jgi:hypothetical protein
VPRPLRLALVVVGLAAAVYGVASLTGGWLGVPPRGRARESSVVDDLQPSPPPQLAAFGRRPAASNAAPPLAPGENDPKNSLEGIRADIDAHRWARARSRLEALAASNPDLDDTTSRARDALRETFDHERGKHLAAIAGLRLPEILRARIEAKVGVPDVAYVDVAAWMRKESIDGAFDSLYQELLLVDPMATPGEAKNAWDSRPRTDESWKPIPEGFPVASAREFNRDSWWAGLSKELRTSAWLAHLVERSGLFEAEERNGVRSYR